MLILFLKAFLIGLGLSIPTGPVGVLCIKNTLNKSRISGFITGLGASLGDLLYATIVVIGMGKIISFLDEYTWPIKIVSFFILFSLALYTFFKKVKSQNAEISFQSGFESIVSSFLLVITSPSVLISFVLAFPFMEIPLHNIGVYGKIVLIVGVVIGSLTWWYLLSLVTHVFKDRLPNNILGMVNKISGVILMIFATLVLFYDIILRTFYG